MKISLERQFVIHFGREASAVLSSPSTEKKRKCLALSEGSIVYVVIPSAGPGNLAVGTKDTSSSRFQKDRRI